MKAYKSLTNLMLAESEHGGVSQAVPIQERRRWAQLYFLFILTFLEVFESFINFLVSQVLASLKRLASGVLTHPVTIGQMIDKHTPKRKKDKPKSIHLMGTDRPEVIISPL